MSDRPRENGWQALRRRKEASFEGSVEPIKSALRRQELTGSIVELFVSALLGIVKDGLGGRRDRLYGSTGFYRRGKYRAPSPKPPTP